ncbi:uncharacterized protein ARMOST_05771 [Armillaria ostoyae]|uniref:Uncharacterized protein n=1 Tax=Armillaria ostoyae TaxID=47428 RepID=A0A284R152_ARMOS|nr:uncharacterized protein ARMOST_05771 [Armillaria ostoyae]
MIVEHQTFFSALVEVGSSEDKLLPSAGLPKDLTVFYCSYLRPLKVLYKATMSTSCQVGFLNAHEPHAQIQPGSTSGKRPTIQYRGFW